MLKKIKKATTATPAPEATHVLTDMKIAEVSTVNRAANRRTFLVTKEDAARAAAKAEALGDAAPAAAVTTATTKDDLGSSDLPPMGSPAAHAHAASAHAAAASAHAAAADASEGDKKKKTEKTAAPALTPPGVSAADPIAEMAALTKTLEGKTEKGDVTDVTVAANEDGSLTISVDSSQAPIVSPAPAAIVDAVKVAVLAGIDAVKARVDMLRESVSNSKGSYSMSGTPVELYDIWYIRDMLCALYDIGGPSWEIEQAVDGATDAIADMAKAVGVPISKNKVISKARIMKMQASHKAMKYAHDDMAKVLKELDSEGGDATGEMARGAAAVTTTPDGTPPSSFAKAEEKIDIEKNPIVIALREQLAKSSATITALEQTTKNQAQTIAKARGIAPASNALVASSIEKSSVQEDDTVVWDRDLAAPARPISKSFGRDGVRR